MAHLCAFKRTAEFTDLQVIAWHGGLATFPPWVINKAVITLGASTERFPEFGDMYQLCRRFAIQAGLMKEPYSPTGSPEKDTITGAEIATIGQCLGLPTAPQ